MTEQEVKPVMVPDEKQLLNKRLEGIAWGLFLIMLGGLSFIPDSKVPEGVWSLGVGVIMLGLNVVRYIYKIKMSGFTTMLGIIALLSGAAELFGLDLPVLAILLILLGAYLILKPWFEKNQVFEKKDKK